MYLSEELYKGPDKRISILGLRSRPWKAWRNAQDRCDLSHVHVIRYRLYGQVQHMVAVPTKANQFNLSRNEFVGRS